MRVYHGTTLKNARNICDNGIDLTRSNTYLDFGRGFYVTPEYSMAKNMAYRVTMRDRQFGYDLPAIICFEYTENLELNYKKFADENLEWAKFVIANRVPIEIALKLGFPENNVDQKYDIVIGSTADGCVANIASNLRYGKILPENYKLDIADFLKEDGSTYGMQIVFCTPKSLSCIKYVKCDILDKRGDIHEKKGKRI